MRAFWLDKNEPWGTGNIAQILYAKKQKLGLIKLRFKDVLLNDMFIYYTLYKIELHFNRCDAEVIIYSTNKTIDKVYFIYE